MDFLATKPLEFVCRCPSLPVPGGIGVPQVMPPEILNPGSLQRIAPSLGVDLDDRIAVVSENMGRVIALPPLQHIYCGVIERYRMRLTVFVIGCRHP